MSLPRAWMLSMGLLLIVGALGCGRRDATIAAIEKLGGRVECDSGSLLRPVVHVSFYGVEVTDAGVNELKKALPNCRISH